MADDNEVLLRIAADVSDATTALGMLVGMMGEFAAQYAATQRVAEESSESVKKSNEQTKQSFLDVAAGMSSVGKAAYESAQVNQKLVDGMSAAGKAAEEAKNASQSFWMSWITGANESATASVAWGQQLSQAFDTLKQGVKDALTAFPSMVDQMARAGDEAGTLANRLNLTAEQVGELRYIAEQSGASMEGLARTIQTAGAEFRDGTSKQAQAVEALGLNLEQLNKQSDMEQFFTVLKTIQDTVPVSEQSAKAMEVFGAKFRSSTMLLKEDVAGLRERFKELGGPEGLGALAKAGDDYTDALNDIQLVQDNFKRQIANAVLPEVNKLLEAMPNLGGAVLTIGEGFSSAAQSILPLVTNLVLLNGPGGLKGLMETIKKGIPSLSGVTGLFTGLGGTFTKLVPAIGGAVTSLGSFSGILAAITGPVGLTVAAVTALGVAVYKLMGGWDGIKEAMSGVITLFSDLYTIAVDLGEKAFKGLVDWVKDTVDWFSNLFTTISQMAGAGFDLLISKVSDLIGYFKQLPIVGPIIDGIAAAFKKIGDIVGVVWGGVKSFAGGVVDAFKGAASYVHGWAEGIREADKATQDATKTNEDHAKSQVKVVSALDRMLGKASEVDKAFRALNATQKAQIKTLLDTGNSAKDVAEVMAKSMGVSVDVAQKAIEKFKKSLETAEQAAKKNPFNQLMKDVAALEKGLAGAAKIGAPAAAVIEQFGKKAAEAVAQARTMPGALAKVPPEVQKIAKAWADAQLAPKLKELTEKALELAKAFSGQVTAGARAAVAAITSMSEEMRLNMMGADEVRMARLDAEQKKATDAIKAEKTALDVSLAGQIVAIKKHTAERVKVEQEAAGAGQKISDERMAAIKAEEAAAIANAEFQVTATKEQYDAQLRWTEDYYEQKRAIDRKETGNYEKDAELHGLITKKMIESEIRQHEQKLAFMKANRTEFTTFEIKAQEQVVNAAKDQLDFFEKEAKQLGLRTKKQYADLVELEEARLKFMKDNAGEFTNVAIREQEKVVREAKKAATQTSTSWETALESMSRAFADLAEIAGETFGGIAKSVGETIASINVMQKGIKQGMDGMGDGIAKFKDAFGKAGGGVKGTMKGIAGSIGEIGGAISAIVGAAAAAVQVGKKMWDAFTKSAGEKAAKEVGRDFGVTISEEMGDAFAKTAKELFKGDRFAANLYHLSDIIKAAGGITEKNFEQMIGRLRDVFVQIDTGKFTVEQATKVLDENFSAFANHVIKTGKIANKEFAEIIQLQARMGTQSREIMAFVESQSDRLGQALSKVGAALDDDATEEHIARFERLTLAAFNAAVAAGQSYIDALDSIGPALDKLLEKNKKLGRQGSAAAQELLKFREVAAANADLVESASALNEVMLALSNIGGLNAETMADLQAEGVDTFNELTKAGFSENQALQQMKSFLEQVRNAHEELGIPIEANTQALIDQAEAQGVLGEKQMSTNDVLMEGFGAIIKALGGEIPAAFQKMGNAAQQAAATANAAAASVRTSVGDVANTLVGTPWEQWGQQAADASAMAYDGVYALSYGHSPGGLKDVQMWLDRITGFIPTFASAFVSNFSKSYDSTKLVETGLGSVDQALGDVIGTQQDLTAATGRSTQELINSLKLLKERAKTAATTTEDVAEIVDESLTESLAGVSEVLVDMPWKAWADQSVGGAEAAVTGQEELSFKLEDVDAALEKMQWEQWKLRTVVSTDTATGQLIVVDDAVTTIAKSLNENDWTSWADRIVDAANRAFEAINAVAFGRSPGGIKEIPIQFAKAWRSAQEFSRRMQAEMEAAKKQADALAATASEMTMSRQDFMTTSMRAFTDRERGVSAKVVDRDQQQPRQTASEQPVNLVVDGQVLATAMLRNINGGGLVHGTFRTMVNQVRG